MLCHVLVAVVVCKRAGPIEAGGEVRLSFARCGGELAVAGRSVGCRMQMGEEASSWLCAGSGRLVDVARAAVAEKEKEKGKMHEEVSGGK